jgi:hypothetical protein
LPENAHVVIIGAGMTGESKKEEEDASMLSEKVHLWHTNSSIKALYRKARRWLYWRRKM